MTEKEILLRLKRVDENHHEFTLANDAVINHDQDFFYLRLAQSIPPAILDHIDADAYEQTGEINVPIVGNFVLPARFMPNLIRILQENYDNYIAHFSTAEETEQTNE